MIRKHIIFYGQIQSVGFRYRVQHAANLYRCTGWVRNEWDAVTMEIQGEEDNIDQVILAIKREIYVRIENMACHTIPTVEKEYGFQVRQSREL